MMSAQDLPAFERVARHLIDTDVPDDECPTRTTVIRNALRVALMILDPSICFVNPSLVNMTVEALDLACRQHAEVDA